MRKNAPSFQPAPFILIIILLSAGIAFAENAISTPTEGGNITNANVSAGGGNATWHGVVGLTSMSAFSSMTIPAIPGNVTRTTIPTGSSACTAGVDILNILFSNSSSIITGATPGNLGTLDGFISSFYQGGTLTFTENTTFTTAAFGNISGVPTAYTISPVPKTFRMGYLNDAQGNLVFMMPVVYSQPGFDSQLYDFQFMLPTANASITNYYLSVDLKCKSPPPPPPPPPPGPSGGGGGGGGGGAGFSYTSLPSVDIPVNLGNGIICMVNVRRSMTVSKEYSVVVTTLTNNGGPECTLYDFVFQDTIPSEFALIPEISFSPPYNSVKGQTIFFIFPVFAPGESRSLTYSVQRQIPQSRMESFTTPVVLSANRGNPYLNLVPQFNQTQPGKPSAAPACVISIYCEPWGPCGADGYRSQHCKDVSKCTDIEFFNVEKDACVKKETPTLLPDFWRNIEKGICTAFPQLCSEQAPQYDVLCLCASAVLVAVLLIAIFAASTRRKKRKERGEALEPARPPLARKEMKAEEWELGGTGASEYGKALELPEEKREEVKRHEEARPPARAHAEEERERRAVEHRPPEHAAHEEKPAHIEHKRAPPVDRYSHLSPKLRALIEERARREEERDRERRAGGHDERKPHEERKLEHEARHEEKIAHEEHKLPEHFIRHEEKPEQEERKMEHPHREEKPAHIEHKPPEHAAHHEEKREEKTEEKKPVSREPQWHTRGDLVIKPIYPDEEKKKERKREKEEEK